MAADNIIRTYSDTSIAEDVLDIVENLSPTEDSLFRLLGKSTAYDVVHQWLVDTLPTTATAGAQAVQFGALVATTPSRSVNLTEYIYVDQSVTDQQRAVDHYGFGDRLAYEQQKAMKAWRNKAEADILRSSLVSGASGYAPQMIGIINCISTNKTAQTSGTVWSQSILDGLLALAWDNGNGEPVTDLFMGSKLKTLTSAFSGRTGTQFVIPADAERLVTTTANYASDFGDLKVHLHRYIGKDYAGSADATGRVLGIAANKFKIAYLNGMTPKTEVFGRRGASYDFRVSGELTVESLNEKTSFYASGYKKD